MRKLLLLSVVAWGLSIPPAAGLADASVTALGTSFSPPTVTIAPGEKVTWTNPALGQHNVKFEDGQFEVPVEPSTSWPDPVERTFASVGTYAYYCELHGGTGGAGMSGTVIVEEPGEEPDPTPPTTVLTKPLNGRTYPASKTRAFRGTASDPSGPIAAVHVALRRTMRSGVCGWWNGDGFIRGRCSTKRFRSATGTSSWSFGLGERLRPSRGTKIAYYTMFSRGRDADGNTETQFNKGRNVAQFEVKRG